MIHGSTPASLAGELAVAVGAACVGGWCAASLATPAFLAIVVLAVALLLPDLALVLLAGPLKGSAVLALILLPLLAWGWRTIPRGQWHEARRLGVGRMLALHRLVVPALAPFVLGGCLLGLLLLGVKWRLDTHPAPIEVPYPPIEAG